MRPPSLSRPAPAPDNTSLWPRPVLPPLLEELRLPFELASLKQAPPLGRRPVPVSDGRPVLLIPGLLAGDASLRWLSAFLRQLGYTPCRAGIRCNADCSEHAVARLLPRVDRLAARHEQPVIIVGHSRGGLYGRAIARRRPDVVAGLITLGSPQRDQLAVHPLLWAHLLVLGSLGSLGAPGFARLGCGSGTCCAAFREDLAGPLPPGVECLSIYSRRDGVIDWRACLDPAGRHAEVAASHCGMAANGEVFGVIARELARLGRGPAAVNIAGGAGQGPCAPDAEGSEQCALATAGS